MQRLLVVGVPRSGTTWVANVLARAAGASYLEEPDNHFRFAHAFAAKRRLGMREYPLLAPGETGARTEWLERLWRRAFTPAPVGAVSRARRRAANRLVRVAGARTVSNTLAGAPRPPSLRAAETLAVPETAAPGGCLVVKSVYAPLCAEWVAGAHDVEVAVVIRNPLNVLSSWIALDWLDPDGPEALSTLDPAAVELLRSRFGAPPPPPGALPRATWLIGMLTCALEDAAARNPSWRRVEHEQLCAAPHDAFPSLAAGVRLPWSARGDALLDAENRPGRGYETARVAAELRDAWRARLDEEQVREIRAVLDALPLPR